MMYSHRREEIEEHDRNRGKMRVVYSLYVFVMSQVSHAQTKKGTPAARVPPSAKKSQIWQLAENICHYRYTSSLLTILYL